MAEIFGIVTGVIGVVSPFVYQVEQLVQRCEAVSNKPADVKRLARDYSGMHFRLCQLQCDLADPDRKRLADDDLGTFCPTVEEVLRYFRTARSELGNMQIGTIGSLSRQNPAKLQHSTMRKKST